MYKAFHKGTAKGKSGKDYFWNIGDTVDVSENELKGAYGLKWEGESKQDVMNSLDEKGIDYDGRSSLSTLKSLLNDNS